MELLIFGGTAEGRQLAETLAGEGFSVTCSVATEYGCRVIEPQSNLTVLTGRLDRGEMERLMASRPFSYVVDATHPYAALVSAAIAQAAQAAGLPLLRLVREREVAEDVLWADSPEEAAHLLNHLDGPVLLTTGSKELAAFTAVEDYQNRLWVRVLPSLDSLSKALELGFPPKHIICMQGPFSVALNAATLEQIGARTMVTKDTGKAGGFSEKAQAARQAGAQLLVIRRPTQEQGYSLQEVLTQLWEGGHHEG